MTTMSYTVGGREFVFSDCITCGVTYAVPKTMWDKQRQSGGYHHCSNGHSQGWDKTESEDARIRRERDQLKQQNARLEEEASFALVRAEKAEKATKRLKKRASAGTCPCCQRTFSNMAEHMKHQHPQFVSEGGAKVVPLKRA
jgi:hypothetical protein